MTQRWTVLKEELFDPLLQRKGWWGYVLERVDILVFIFSCWWWNSSFNQKKLIFRITIDLEEEEEGIQRLIYLTYKQIRSFIPYMCPRRLQLSVTCSIGRKLLTRVHTTDKNTIIIQVDTKQYKVQIFFNFNDNDNLSYFIFMIFVII